MDERPVQQLFDLTGRAALVIGGAGYLGNLFVRALAEAGAQVAIASRDADRAAQTAAALPNSEKHTGIALDIRDEAATRAGVDHVAAHFGHLDILVNSVVHHRRAGLEETTQADFDEALNATLTGPFIASQQAAQHMRLMGGGSIIHIGSIYTAAGSYPDLFAGLKTPVPPAYHAAKGGLAQLTRHQAVFWAGDNIRVNCLSPGAFPPPAEHRRERHTQTSAAADTEFTRRLESHIPLGRVGQAWELKGALLFLASDASTYVTGQNLFVDGGWTAW